MANCDSSIDITDKEIQRLTDLLKEDNTELNYTFLKRRLQEYYLGCPDINTKINDYLTRNNLNPAARPAAPVVARPPPKPAAVPAAAPVVARPPPKPAPAAPAARPPPAPAARPPAKPAAASVKNTDSSLIEILEDHGVENPKDVLSDHTAPEITTAPPSSISSSRPSSSISALSSASSRSASLRPYRKNLPRKLQEPTTVGVIPGTTKKSTQPSGKPLVLRKKILPCDSLNNDKEYYNLRGNKISSKDNDIPFKNPRIDSANGFFTKNNKLFQIYSNYQSQNNNNLKRFKHIYYIYDHYLLDNIQKIENIMSEINKNISTIKKEAKYRHLLFINEEIQRNFNKIYSIQNEITDNYDCKLPKLNQYIIIDILQTYFLDYYQMLILLYFNKFLNLYLSSYENKDYDIIKIIDKIININIIIYIYI
jgi:hypothetical protein